MLKRYILKIVFNALKKGNEGWVYNDYFKKLRLRTLDELQRDVSYLYERQRIEEKFDENKIKKGDVVKLKSSASPRMTVVDVFEDGSSGFDSIHTVWFTDGRKKYSSFPEEALEKVESTSKK